MNEDEIRAAEALTRASEGSFDYRGVTGQSQCGCHSPLHADYHVHLVIGRDVTDTCRFCSRPIWDEGGSVGGVRHDTGWSDRIETGGDSLVCFRVCFSAMNFRHIPFSPQAPAATETQSVD